MSLPYSNTKLLELGLHNLAASVGAQLEFRLTRVFPQQVSFQCCLDRQSIQHFCYREILQSFLPFRFVSGPGVLVVSTGVLKHGSKERLPKDVC